MAAEVFTIDKMMDISQILFVMAVIFGMASVIIYFALNIHQAWRMVMGRYGKAKVKSAKNVKENNRKVRTYKKVKSAEETVLLKPETNVFEDTELLGEDAGTRVISDIDSNQTIINGTGLLAAPTERINEQAAPSVEDLLKEHGIVILYEVTYINSEFVL